MSVKRLYIILLLSVSGMVLNACSMRALHEAEDVVAQADSLWHNGQMYGIDEGDSATLAQACETLKKHSAAACYHYGRLLRAKDDPVAAMQVFIDATHSRTRDYHILGRVYSNMGSICHLANEFPLSYDMFSHSADCFLKNGDTLLYYYGLNNMAYELAEQGKEEETLALLSTIDKNNPNLNLKANVLGTKAKLFFEKQQYDSVIETVNQILLLGIVEPTSYGFKARAYWHLGNKDSALQCAKQVIDLPAASEQNKYNMLYILANGDSTLSNAAILDISAQRSDIETDTLIPLHNKWALATQLLEQDLNRKLDWKWLIAIIGTLVVIGSIIGLYVYRKGKQKALLSQKIDMLEQTANTIQEKKDELAERYQTERQRIEAEIEEKCALLKNDDSLTKTLAWNDFEAMCHIVDRQFWLLASKLRNLHVLNDTEIRLCVLVLLDLNRKQISQILPYALNSVGKLKDHTAKVLGSTGKNLRNFLLKMITQG